ncbi:hypothetical protein LTR16_004684, partial [Cryomyces antarcticus]
APRPPSASPVFFNESRPSHDNGSLPGIDQNPRSSPAIPVFFRSPIPDPEEEPSSGNFIGPRHRRIPMKSLEVYLDIYHHKMYPIWPVVDKSALVARLRQPSDDAEAYALAAAVCAATATQLQLVFAVSGGDISLDPATMITEVQEIRTLIDYQETPTRERLLTSFFLHVYYIHVEKRNRSSFHLRESITFAQLLNLHREGHYSDLDMDTIQHDLRIYWLLFITERAHATQYDLPTTLQLNPRLPPMDEGEQPLLLSPFIGLCKLFEVFHSASSESGHSRETLAALHQQLQQIPPLPRQYNDLQRADVSITQQWMRLMFWKLSMSHIVLSMDPADGSQSFTFPVQVARDVLSNMTTFSMDTLEAHGQGMVTILLPDVNSEVDAGPQEMKLFEFANTLADVIVCIPSAENSMHYHAQDFLLHFANVLGSFRGGNNALLPLLQKRLADCGVNIPAIPRCLDVTNEFSESDSANSIVVTEGNVSDYDWYPAASVP